MQENKKHGSSFTVSFAPAAANEGRVFLEFL